MTNHVATACDHYRELEPFTGSLFIEYPSHELQPNFALEAWRQILRRSGVPENSVQHVRIRERQGSDGDQGSTKRHAHRGRVIERAVPS